ncbi:MAG: PilZ domain-containing protein [Bryobacteraceae bacterium]
MDAEQTTFDLFQVDCGMSSVAADARRKEPRIAQEPTLVRVATENGEFLPLIAQVANVSKSGIGLKTSKPVPVPLGTPLLVEIRSTLVTGIVRYSVGTRGSAGPYDLGLEITSITRFQ